MGMTGIHRGIESSRDKSRMILPDVCIFDHSSFFWYFPADLQYFWIYFLQPGVLIESTPSGIRSSLQIPYKEIAIYFSGYFTPLSSSIPDPFFVEDFRHPTAGFHWRDCIERTLTPFADVVRSVTTPRPISNPSSASPFRPWNPHAVSPTWHSTARSDSKRISKRHRSLMPLCEIVARLACSKVFFPDSSPLATGLSTVSPRNRGRKGQVSVVDRDPALSLSAFVERKILGRIRKENRWTVDGACNTPAARPIVRIQAPLTCFLRAG